jgi:hypothetical protein
MGLLIKLTLASKAQTLPICPHWCKKPLKLMAVCPCTELTLPAFSLGNPVAPFRESYLNAKALSYRFLPMTVAELPS